MSSKGTATLRGLKVEAINPVDGKRCYVLVKPHVIQRAKQLGEGAIFELAYCVPKVLSAPAVIYEGLCRDEDDSRDDTDGWLCYSATPSCRYRYDTGERIVPAGRVLLVFVNKEKAMYHWRWDEEDPHHPGVPLDRDGRFKQQVMP